MIQVRNKITDKVVNVYSISDDKNGFPQFLVYDKREWKWMSAKHFSPLKSKFTEMRK